MKKLLSLFVVLMMVIILPKNVNASTGELEFSCFPIMKGSTEIRTFSYSKCHVLLTAPTETSGATLHLEIEHNEIPVSFNLIYEYDGAIKNIVYNDWASEYDFNITDGLSGKFIVASFYVEHCWEDYSDINWSMTYINGNETFSDSQELTFNTQPSPSWIYFGGNTHKTLDFLGYMGPNSNIKYNNSMEYINVPYVFVNDPSTEERNALAAFKGTIDLNTIPEGLEIDSINYEDNSGIAGVEINKDNGQFVIDFDISQEGIVYQNSNSVHFNVVYKITDASKLSEKFNINIKDISYISMEDKLTEIELENISQMEFQHVQLGDWNGNNKFNLVDLVAYRMYLAGNDMSDYYEGELTDNLKNIVDLNKDGELSILDLISARKVLVGLPIE